MDEDLRFRRQRFSRLMKEAVEAGIEAELDEDDMVDEVLGLYGDLKEDDDAQSDGGSA